MSCHRIIYKDGAKHLEPVTDEAYYRKIRGTQYQIDIRQRALKGEKVIDSRGREVDIKTRLQQFNYSCMPNADGTLKESQIGSNTVAMDVDFDHSDPDYEQKMADAPQLILGMKDSLQLLMLERSATKGYHLVTRRRDDLDQEGNLRWLSDQIGIAFDECAKDITRVFFTTTDSEDDLLYVHPDLFVNEPADVQYDWKTYKQTAKTPLDEDEDDTTEEPQHDTPTDYPDDYDGIPYPTLVESLAEQLGGVPVHGSRNHFIFSMACNLRYVCNDDSAWIARVLPTYGEDVAKVRETVRSACNRAQSRTLPEIVKRAISIARQKTDAEEIGAYAMGPTPPPMPEKLPPLIRHLISNVPEHLQPAVANAIFPALGAHLHGVRFRYIDNQYHEPTLMCVCIGRQSAGKGSVNEPIKHVMKDIKARDNESRARLKEWKLQMRTKGANDEKPVRPSDICIQMPVSDMTNAALTDRLNDAEAAGDRFLYTKMNEIEQLDMVSATGGKKPSVIVRLAFDCEEYGQERVGVESVEGNPHLRWNWNASTTEYNAAHYFRSWLHDGTLSRVNVCTVIKLKDRRKVPVYGDYDEKYDKVLKPYIDALNSASGVIECKQAHRFAFSTNDELADICELSGDDDYEDLSYRANVIAWMKAMVLYVAQGRRWTKEIAEFCRWSLHYDLWCKMRYFGEQMKNDHAAIVTPRRFGPRNLLDLLPTRFAREQFLAVYRSQNKTGDPDTLLSVWMTRKYIFKDEPTGEYVKTQEYLAKHNT